MIPANRIDPTAQKLLALLPLPNLPNADGSYPETDNYFVQAPFVLNRWTVDSKVNWNATSKLNVFGRFSVLDFFTENGTNFGQRAAGCAAGQQQPGHRRRKYLQRLRQAPPTPCRTTSSWTRTSGSCG